MSAARLLIFWQLTDRLATTGQLTASPVVSSINWGWGELVLDLTTKAKRYELWQFMWLFPPPCTSCCGAYTEKRKGSWHILGWRPALLPTGRAKGNPPGSVPQSLGPSNITADKASKKVNGASLKPARVTLRCLPHLCWGLLYWSQANHMPNTSNPSAHHPNHQPRWVPTIKEDCEEQLQAHFCWSWASFNASGESLLVNTCHVTEALDVNSWEQAPLLVPTPPGSVSLSQTLWASVPSNILQIAHCVWRACLWLYTIEGYSAWGMNEPPGPQNILGKEREEKESVWHEVQTALCSFIFWEFRKSASSAVREFPSTY